MDLKTLQIDIGASAVKAIYGDEKIKFATAITQINLVQGFNLMTKSIQYKDKHFTVGNISNKNILSRDFNYFKEYSPLLVYKVLLMFGIDVVDDIELNIGFSYLYKDNFTQIVQELREFVCDDNAIKFNNINIFIQGQGIYNTLDTKGLVAIYDIGYHTNDFLVFDDGELIETKSDKHGIVQIVSKLKDKLNYSYDLELSEQKVNIALQDRYITIGGEEYDLGDTIDELVDEYTTKTKQNLKVEFGSVLQTCDAVIVGGGGANYFQNISFPKNTKILPDEYLNAVGYVTNYHN